MRIAGQDVEVVTAETAPTARDPFRQESGLYKGAAGRTYFSIAGKTSTWDQGLVDQILMSLK